MRYTRLCMPGLRKLRSFCARLSSTTITVRPPQSSKGHPDAQPCHTRVALTAVRHPKEAHISRIEDTGRETDGNAQQVDLEGLRQFVFMGGRYVEDSAEQHYCNILKNHLKCEADEQCVISVGGQVA